MKQPISNMSEPIAKPDSARILIVEDNENNRDLLRRRLEKEGHGITECENGLIALQRLETEKFDLVLLDLMMPEVDGYQVLQAIRKNPKFVNMPVIVITALNDVETAVKCIELGAEDYLPKPFNPTLLKARINTSLNKKRFHDKEEEYRLFVERTNRELSDRVRNQVKEITSAQMAAIFAMSKLSESRDPETGAHLERMREYCKIISEYLGKLPAYSSVITKQFVENIYAASPLHDIGKVGVPDDILLKNGSLTDEEWKIMRTHPVIGADTLRAVDKQHPGNEFIKTGIAIAEHHHEKWDGNGYPYGLSGESIPIEARILALGDVYDALTSKRCYKEAFSHEKTRGIILDSSGKHFDPAIVNAFTEMEDEFIRIRSHFTDTE